MLINTEIHYLYRDAGNYKFRGMVVCKGMISKLEITNLFIDLEFFVPTLVGLPSLVPLRKNTDDHPFHEIEDVIETSAEDYDLTAEDFLHRLRLANENGWGQ